MQRTYQQVHCFLLQLENQADHNNILDFFSLNDKSIFNVSLYCVLIIYFLAKQFNFFALARGFIFSDPILHQHVPCRSPST